MKNSFGLVLLALGIVLLVFGISGASLISSEFSKWFSGADAAKTVWMIIAGLVATILGALSTFRNG